MKRTAIAQVLAAASMAASALAPDPRNIDWQAVPAKPVILFYSGAV